MCVWGGRPGHRPLGSGEPNVDGVGECPLPPNRRLKTAFGIARFTSSESLLGLVAWPLTHLQSLTHTAVRLRSEDVPGAQPAPAAVHWPC